MVASPVHRLIEGIVASGWRGPAEAAAEVLKNEMTWHHRSGKFGIGPTARCSW
jgi:hypothetical protein